VTAETSALVVVKTGDVTVLVSDVVLGVEAMTASGAVTTGASVNMPNDYADKREYKVARGGKRDEDARGQIDLPLYQRRTYEKAWSITTFNGERKRKICIRNSRSPMWCCAG